MNKKIMIVDDDQSIRDVLAEVLLIQSYNVVLASDGCDALSKLELMEDCGLPDLIILDLQMPNLDGVGFLEGIKKSGSSELCKIPIIVATAMGASETSRFPESMTILKKPFDLDELLTIVASEIRKK